VPEIDKHIYKVLSEHTEIIKQINGLYINTGFQGPCGMKVSPNS